MDEDFAPGHHDWPQRPWLTAAIMGAAGFALWLLGGPFETYPDAWQAALAAAIFTGAVALSFTVAPREWRAPAIFAALCAAVMAGIAWRWALGIKGTSDAPFWLFAGAFGLGLALPLFQAGFHRLRLATPYRETHYHVWADAVSLGGAIAFTLLAWAVLFLLAGLFVAIKIEVLRDLIGEGWFGWSFTGIAFGAALGVLRNQLRVIGALQNVVLLVLALIAVPMALALVLFLAAVLLSGIDVLWSATQSATPLLLFCAAGAFILVNAIIRDSAENASGSRIMRIAARVLALGILPLAVLAALSMGTRIAQYGFSPERLWGLVTIVIAVTYGVAYAAALLRGWRGGWQDAVRQANLHLALVSIAIALLLALPVLDFGAISARSQVARLESGKVAAEDFDYEALRWDFGPGGRRALAALGKRQDEAGRLARRAAAATVRTYPYDRRPADAPADLVDIRIADPALRQAAKDWLRDNPYRCQQACVVIDRGTVGGRRQVLLVQQGGYDTLVLNAKGLLEYPPPPVAASGLRLDSQVEIRRLEREFIVVDGKPVGQPLE